MRVMALIVKTTPLKCFPIIILRESILLYTYGRIVSLRQIIQLTFNLTSYKITSYLDEIKSVVMYSFGYEARIKKQFIFSANKYVSLHSASCFLYLSYFSLYAYIFKCSICMPRTRII